MWCLCLALCKALQLYILVRVWTLCAALSHFYLLLQPFANGLSLFLEPFLKKQWFMGWVVAFFWIAKRIYWIILVWMSCIWTDSPVPTLVILSPSLLAYFHHHLVGQSVLTLGYFSELVLGMGEVSSVKRGRHLGLVVWGWWSLVPCWCLPLWAAHIRPPLCQTKVTYFCCQCSILFCWEGQNFRLLKGVIACSCSWW